MARPEPAALLSLSILEALAPQDLPDIALAGAEVHEMQTQDADFSGVEHSLLDICSYLPLKWALQALMTCRSWSSILHSHLPLVLPPPQGDALLQLCLMEVLLHFDEDRLPLPLSALYSEMIVAGRRLAASPRGCQRLESLICRSLGPACKAQQQRFLQDILPHHVAWSPDVKTSGFKSLERMGKHFHDEKFIGIFVHTFHKRLHHSPNTRTCREQLLKSVNRQHKLYIEHEAWSNEVPEE
jgi:hypothetical protein